MLFIKGRQLRVALQNDFEFSRLFLYGRGKDETVFTSSPLWATLQRKTRMCKDSGCMHIAGSCSPDFTLLSVINTVK